MFKPSLIAASIAMATASTAYAAPFAPADTRSIGMGGTGVAAAERHSAILFNPALLSTAREEDDFSFVLQGGLFIADEDEFVNGANDFVDADHPDALDDLLTGPSGIESVMDTVTAEVDTITSLVDSISAGTPLPANSLDNLNAAVGQLNLLTGPGGELRTRTTLMSNDLDAISGRALYGTLGLGAGIAIPSKSLAAAVTVNTNVTFAGLLDVSKRDLDTLSAYVGGVEQYTAKVDNVNTAVTNLDAANTTLQNLITAGTTSGAAFDSATTAVNLRALIANDALNQLDNFEAQNADGETLISVVDGATEIGEPTLTSTSRIVGIAVSEVGLGLSTEFNFDFGIAGGLLDKWAIGVTPKIQRIDIYDYSYQLDSEDDFEAEDFTDTAVSETAFNVDVGIAKPLTESGSLIAGFVIKNLIPYDYESENNLNKKSVEISMEPQVRVGISHRTEWTVITADLDLTENSAIAFESPTRYAAFGGEFDLFDTLQLRAGYRTNLSDTEDKLATVGLGFSPFGAHLDISAGANPSNVERNAAVGLELGFYF